MPVAKRIVCNQYLLSPEGKSVVVGAIMRRLNETTAWRGKQYTLKQIIDNQIRALARHFVEKEDKYNPFGAEKLFSIS